MLPSVENIHSVETCRLVFCLLRLTTINRLSIFRRNARATNRKHRPGLQKHLTEQNMVKCGTRRGKQEI